MQLKWFSGGDISKKRVRTIKYKLKRITFTFSMYFLFTSIKKSDTFFTFKKLTLNVNCKINMYHAQTMAKNKHLFII